MADNASTTNTPSDASSTVEIPKQSFDQLFTFDGGDVEITAIFQGQKVVGKVAAQAMVLASPVWKKFLFPPWNVDTGDKTQAKAIDFTEDDGCALLILLRLAHLQFSHVPSKISPDTLFQVAILCEKYGCFDLVDPRLEEWINHAKSTAMADETGKWLYISWAFGLKHLFSLVAEKGTKTWGFRDGDMTTTSGTKLAEPMPEQILESISSIRATTIKRILETTYAAVEEYSNSGTNSLCYAKEAGCDAIVYGSLLLGLKKVCLWPERKDMTYSKSVEATAKCIRSVAIHTLQLSSSSSSLFINSDLQRHKMCTTPRFWAEIDRIVAEMPSPVLKCHTRHMETLRSCTVPTTDPLMHDTLCAKCSEIHSAMVACAPNAKKRPASAL